MILNPPTAQQELIALSKAESAVRAALKELAESSRQQTELRSRLDQALAAGEVDDTKAVNQIGQDRTRLEMLTAKISKQTQLADNATGELSSACSEFQPVFSRIAGEARAAAQSRLEKCLADEGIPAIHINSIMPSLLSQSDLLLTAESHVNICSSVLLMHAKTPQSLLLVAANIRRVFDLHVAES